MADKIATRIKLVRKLMEGGARPAVRQAAGHAGVLAGAIHDAFGTTSRRSDGYELRQRASGGPMVRVGKNRWVDFTEAERGPDGKPRLKRDAEVSRSYRD